MSGKIFAMIPTYNESENIGLLIRELRELDCNISVVVVDDDSPDGTHRIVAELSAQDSSVHLVHRKGVRGRGSAGVSGFKKAIELGADIIIEMDADFSHPTRYIPRLIKALEGVDVVFASRLVRGGGEVNRSLKRVAITKGANFLTRHLMGYPVHDCTAGYRLFRRHVLEGIDLDSLSAEGPAIVGEVLYRVIRKGYAVREIPYIYEDRKFGTSSLSGKALFGCLGWLIRLKWKQMTQDRAAFLAARKIYASCPPEPPEEPWSGR